MTREIKFRAWNKDKLEMYETINNWDFSDNQYECMQYTGLKDKNGKEIFEGDLVTVRQGGHISTVEFVNGCFRMVHTHKDLTGAINGEYEQVLGFLVIPVEIVGNLYENPELIK